jgi:threonine dehydrogenase-like Zn-dependent dehydrogenase
MQALAVFPSKKKVDLLDIPKPRLNGATEVLLRLREVGLCGTDREIASFEYGDPPRGADHLILGHESLAEVIEVGRDVRSLKPGDLTVPMVRRPCPHPECGPCRAGRPDFCVTGDFTERGIKGADGFLTDYVIDDEAYLVRVPRALADVAVLVEPLTVVTKAVDQASAIFARLPYDTGPQRGLALGAGPIGLLAAMVLVADGFETFVYSRDSEESEPAELVRSLGAHYASSITHSLESLAQASGKFDVVLEAVGFAPLMLAATQMLKRNGVLALTGVPPEAATAELNAGRALRNLVLRNEVVFGTVNAGRRDYLSAIQSLEQFMVLFPESVRKLITQRVSLAEVPQMLTQKRGIKNVVEMSRAA